MPRTSAWSTDDIGSSTNFAELESPPFLSIQTVGPSCDESWSATTPIVLPLRSLATLYGASLAHTSTVVGAALLYCAAGAM